MRHEEEHLNPRAQPALSRAPSGAQVFVVEEIQDPTWTAPEAREEGRTGNVGIQNRIHSDEKKGAFWCGQKFQDKEKPQSIPRFGN